jgi:hypothetical protein
MGFRTAVVNFSGMHKVTDRLSHSREDEGQYDIPEDKMMLWFKI